MGWVWSNAHLVWEGDECEEEYHQDGEDKADVSGDSTSWQDKQLGHVEYALKTEEGDEEVG